MAFFSDVKTEHSLHEPNKNSDTYLNYPDGIYQYISY
jgi:hypothetical protein